MIFGKMEDIIRQMIVEAGQFPGIGTQTFTEDAMASYIQTIYEKCITRQWWPHARQWSRRTLNGVDGKTTVGLPDIVSCYDIEAVFPENDDQKLSYLPSDINPMRLEGDYPQYISFNDEAGYPFIVWPLTATQNIDICWRKRVTEITTETVLNFDKTTLAQGALWLYLASDAHNAGHTATMSGMFEDSLGQWTKAASSQPIILDPRITRYPTRWY